MPVQARNQQSVFGNDYGVPWLSDDRGLQFNPAVLAQCNVSFPPTSPDSSWTYAALGRKMVQVARCVDIPYWQQECTTLVFVTSWLQSRGVRLANDDGSFGWNTPLAKQVWLQEILPTLLGSGAKMVRLWINDTAPAMALYLKTPLGQYDVRNGCPLGQLTCQIPRTAMSDVAVGMVIGGAPIQPAVVPGYTTFGVYWYFSVSNRSSSVQQDVAWRFAAYNANFSNADGPAARTYQKMKVPPVMVDGRCQSLNWTTQFTSSVKQFNQECGIDMAFPGNAANVMPGLANWEVRGRVNMLIACLALKNGNWSYCIGEAQRGFVFDNLPACRYPADAAFVISSMCDDPVCIAFYCMCMCVVAFVCLFTVLLDRIRTGGFDDHCDAGMERDSVKRHLRGHTASIDATGVAAVSCSMFLYALGFSQRRGHPSIGVLAHCLLRPSRDHGGLVVSEGRRDVCFLLVLGVTLPRYGRVCGRPNCCPARASSWARFRPWDRLGHSATLDVVWSWCVFACVCPAGSHQSRVCLFAVVLIQLRLCGVDYYQQAVDHLPHLWSYRFQTHPAFALDQRGTW